ncbi:DUF4279 domain-containing protein [uncultured Microscilla sp.]|uniref:DUF4279 domain-containing protein n=1 Tax=uncultured Microscilla sp. TaxID=432653 RepID=UPI002619203B|nr:DUF4279 domain-containing protein [uncultured Microscilla sp.]
MSTPSYKEQSVAKGARIEASKKFLSSTRKCLTQLEVIQENQVPKISHLTFDDDEQLFKVFFPIKDHHLYLVICIDSVSCSRPKWSYIQQGNGVLFAAASDTLTFEELQAMTSIKATEGWSKGQLKKNSSNQNEVHRYSSFTFEPIREGFVYMTEKLTTLLDMLEADIEGVRRLAEVANAGIQVYTYDFAEYGNLPGVHLSKEVIRKLGNMHLDIDFEMYVNGNLLK